MEHRSVVCCYREYAPDERLREHVRAVFSFVPGRPPVAPGRRVIREIVAHEGDSFCAPVFADGNGSIVIELGMLCREQAGWHRSTSSARGVVIGPMSHVGATTAYERAEMVGAYFRAAGASTVLDVSAAELTDLVVPLTDVWSAVSSDFAPELDTLTEAARIERLEAELIRRLGKARDRYLAVNIAALATLISAEAGRRSVDRLAAAAGVSRQHLTRVFRDRVGVTPKLYSRLARFQSGLAYSGVSAVHWSSVAADLGYADQSHMIAEFREFSSLTPQQLSARHWFHPFIERAKSRQRLFASASCGPRVDRRSTA